MSNQAQDYKSMMQELQALINEMQTEELDVDDVIVKYERGQKLLIELKKYLDTAENKIIKHKLPINSKTN